MVDSTNSSSDDSQAESRSRDNHRQALIGLAARMDDFLDSVGSRLITILDECEHAVAEQANLSRKNSEFQRERNDWERQRQQEIANIRSECEQLAVAWVRLEDADRDRLVGINQRGYPGSTNLNAAPVAETPGRRIPDMRQSDFAMESALVEVNPSASRTGQPAVEDAPVSTLTQFQQLKRDIRNHAQRKS